MQNREDAQIDPIVANFYSLVKRSHMRNPEHPVLVIYKTLIEDAIQFLSDFRETYEKMEVKSNLAVHRCKAIHGNEKYLEFDTIRNNETVQVDIDLRQIELKFYDDDEENPDEYCLEIYVHKKLSNPGKLQQEFSTFLASENHNLIDFITETIWPHIDESVKKEEQRAQRKTERLNRFDRETIPRKDHPRYSLRTLKKNEEKDRMQQDVENSQDDRRVTRSIRNIRYT